MDFVKKARLAKGMTLKQVAQETGVAECYISLIESGERRPSVETAKKIAGTLGFAWTRFFEEQEGREKCMVLQKGEESLDIRETVGRAKLIARAMIEEAAEHMAGEKELKLAYELALAAYREAAEVHTQSVAHIEEKIEAAFAARQEKKPPTPKGERCVWAKLEVWSKTEKETCFAKISEAQAGVMMEQLMAEPDDGIEE